MLSGGASGPASVAVLDLREGGAPVEVRFGVRVSDAVDLPEELRKRNCAVLLVLSEHTDERHEQQLRTRVAEMGVTLCWVRLPSAGEPTREIRAQVDRMQRLLQQTPSVLASLSTDLATTAARQPDASSFDLSALSARERDVLEQVRQGLPNKEIGQRLGLSPHTVGNHLRAIYRKLGVSGRHALLARLASR